MHCFFPDGVCSKQILFDVDDGIVHNVNFVGGCPGNLQGLSRLVEGMAVKRVIETLEGIRCGERSTSCPDQLAEALQRLESV
jgi:uncharacterized protein (TIGR03905 family)